MSFQFAQKPSKPVVIAGPCMAENYDLMRKVAAHLVRRSKELDFTFIFKSSFDKANRTSINSYRGPGIKQTMEWFKLLKDEFNNLPVLTDVHECWHVQEVAEYTDVIQIPAFLCRQTDLIVEAVNSGRAVNVKKGQFLAPENAQHIISKIIAAAEQKQLKPNYAVTERGTTFGYGNLVVDMRGLKIMSDMNAPVIFDVTHSLQLPAAGGTSGEISGGLRHFAPTLARAATATGQLDGFFIEVHTDPTKAKSDASTQLSIEQADLLLSQLVPLWKASGSLKDIDARFQ